MARLRAAALAILIAAAAGPAAAADPCEMAPADRAWVVRSIAAWPATRGEVLALPPAPLPDLTVYDARCAYVSRSGSTEFAARPHGSERVVIDGRSLPLGPYAAADTAGRFTMSLPSVWRAAGISSGVGLDDFMTGVFLHEVMHTTQADLLIDAQAKFALGLRNIVHLNDDTIQDLFAKNPAYVALYRTELALLHRAANAASDADARRLAGEALAAMDQRRARFFTGRRTDLARLDDTFLTMEGLGQLVMYRYLMAQPDAAANRAVVLGEVRNGGAFWSQDAGFALMRVVERLVPDWQARVFDPKRWQARKLLAAAAAERSA